MPNYQQFIILHVCSCWISFLQNCRIQNQPLDGLHSVSSELFECCTDPTAQIAVSALRFSWKLTTPLHICRPLTNLWHLRRKPPSWALLDQIHLSTPEMIDPKGLEANDW